MKTETYTPFPVGTVRGPYRSDEAFRAGSGSVTYMVQGENGWVPFCRPEKYKGQSEAECEAAARAYAAEILPQAENVPSPGFILWGRKPDHGGGQWLKLCDYTLAKNIQHRREGWETAIAKKGERP